MLLSVFMSEATAQTNPLQDKVSKLTLLDVQGNVRFGPLDDAGVLADSSLAFNPSKYTSVIFSVGGTFVNGSLKAVAKCGPKSGSGLSIHTRCDSVTISAPGITLWSLNIPAIEGVQILFSGASSITNITVDSVSVFRNW